MLFCSLLLFSFVWFFFFLVLCGPDSMGAADGRKGRRHDCDSVAPSAKNVLPVRARSHTRLVFFFSRPTPVSFFLLLTCIRFLYIYILCVLLRSRFCFIILLLPPPLLQPLLRELMDSIRLSLSLVSVFFFSLHLSEVSF